MSREKGFALVVTLLITALLVAVAVEFIHEVFVEASMGQNYNDAQQASLLAESGIQGGETLLVKVVAAQSYTSLLDPWAKPLEMQDERGELRVEITDETGKLDLNSIFSPNGNPQPYFSEIAQRLFRTLKLPSGDLLDSLGDWIDANDDPRPGGAETGYYKSLPVPYQCKNATLDTLDELRMIKGFDDKTVATLRPFVTVIGNRSGITSTINVNTAPREVLAALHENMTDELVRRVIEYRKTTPVKNTADISRIPGMETIGTALQGRIRVSGNIFRIVSRAKVNAVTRTIEAVVRIDGSPAILYWREV